ncbi:MAG: endonuclease/exonuclease/phosphatase family protein [Planctomycetota bacterium]|nr:endonuclease/exonuclease/phosphatase family protein [Planctomycetota bacterium]
MNIWTFAESCDKRNALIREGISELSPDLMAFQEAGYADGRHQVAEILDGMGYRILHQFEVGDAHGNNANCIACRWPFELVEMISLQVTPQAKNYPYAAIAVRVNAPEPVGPILFVNSKPSWELNREYERELQAVELAKLLERHRDRQAFPAVVAGDFDATPDSASIRFLTGRQSLAGICTHLLDAWAQAGDGSAGHTWTYENDFAHSIIKRAIRQPNHARRIDYVFLGSPHDYGKHAQFRECRVVLNRPQDGIWPSDHYAVYAEIDVAT